MSKSLLLYASNLSRPTLILLLRPFFWRVSTATLPLSPSPFTFSLRISNLYAWLRMLLAGVIFSEGLCPPCGSNARTSTTNPRINQISLDLQVFFAVSTLCGQLSLNCGSFVISSDIILPCRNKKQNCAGKLMLLFMTYMTSDLCFSLLINVFFDRLSLTTSAKAYPPVSLGSPTTLIIFTLASKLPNKTTLVTPFPSPRTSPKFSPTGSFSYPFIPVMIAPLFSGRQCSSYSLPAGGS